jgi:UDP-2,3-diacylglucosamine pyrophosphatase LpxH
MLIIISDLHLQHTGADGFQYQDAEGRTHECGVDRNITAEALTLLKDEIIHYRMKFQTKLLRLVLNGDILEILRTPLWLEQGLRPYHEGQPPIELRDLVLKILGKIEEDNQEFLATFRQFFVQKRDERGQPIAEFADMKIEIIYLPGNHDRLVNAWPETRRKVRELLGIPVQDAPFAHELVYAHQEEGARYGVLIRHGHEYDRFNFVDARPSESKAERYLRSPLGDVLALEVGAALSFRFRQRYAEQMARPVAGEVYRRLYLALLDFDDVRPDHTTFEYLTHALNRIRTEFGAHLDEEVAELMRPILHESCNVILKNPFFKRKGTPWLSRFLTTRGMVAHLLWLLNVVPASKLVSLVKMALRLKGFVEKAEPATHAAGETVFQKGEIDLVIAGHTHHPTQVPLECPDARTGYFLDTGTWRTLIYDGPGNVFGHLKSLSYVAVHQQSELTNGRRFDTWTGHLASSRYGTYDHLVSSDPRPARKKAA